MGPVASDKHSREAPDPKLCTPTLLTAVQAQHELLGGLHRLTPAKFDLPEALHPNRRRFAQNINPIPDPKTKPDTPPNRTETNQLHSSESKP